SDPDIAFVVDGYSVIRVGPIVTLAWSSPTRNEVSFLIELQNWGCWSAAYCCRRIRCRMDFVGFERTCAVNDPHMVLSIDGNDNGLSENPVVRQRLWPERVYFETWSHGSCSFNSGLLLQDHTHDDKRAEQREKNRTDVNITLHASPLIGLRNVVGGNST